MTVQISKCSARLCAVAVLLSWRLMDTPVRSAPITTGFTAIEARYASGQDQKRATPAAVDPAELAIDGNLGTHTYLTKSFTSGPVFIYLDLGSAKYVDGLRVHKFNNEYGSHTLAIDYSTGAGPLSTRSYNAVTNLQAGIEGDELPVFGAGGGIIGNSIFRESGGVSAPYAYSATFDGIGTATAIRLTLTDDSVNTHMHVSEIQAIVPEPASVMLLATSSVMLCRRRKSNSIRSQLPG